MSTVHPAGRFQTSAPPGARLRSAENATATPPLPGDTAQVREAPSGPSPWKKAGLVGLGGLALLTGCAIVGGPVGMTAARAAPPPETSQVRVVEQGHRYLLRGKRGFRWLDRLNDRFFPNHAPEVQEAPGRAGEVHRTAPVESTRVGVEILKELSRSGRLYQPGDSEEPDSPGRPLDAFAAKERLERGQPVAVVNPNIGNYEEFYTLQPPAPQDYQRHFRPQTDVVRSYEELARLNHAERLTGRDTSGAYTSGQREILQRLRDFEGGVPEARVQYENGWFPGFYIWNGFGYVYMNPGYYQGYRVTPGEPRPALYSAQKRGGFLGIGSDYDRLSAFEALQELEQGKGVRVVTRRGVTHTVHSAEQLRELHDLEGR